MAAAVLGCFVVVFAILLWFFAARFDYVQFFFNAENRVIITFVHNVANIDHTHGSRTGGACSS